MSHCSDLVWLDLVYPIRYLSSCHNMGSYWRTCRLCSRFTCWTFDHSVSIRSHPLYFWIQISHFCILEIRFDCSFNILEISVDCSASQLGNRPLNLHLIVYLQIFIACIAASPDSECYSEILRELAIIKAVESAFSRNNFMVISLPLLW